MPAIVSTTDALAATGDELGKLFASSPAGPIPVGRGAGTVLLAPGGSSARLIDAMTRALFWQGKVFDPAAGDLHNLLTPSGRPAIRAKVYEGPSRLDGAPCIVLDYSKTSTVARWIRDEIREISPGNYLGIVLLGGHRIPVQFWLDFTGEDREDPPLRLSPDFRLEERPVGWAANAPIRIDREIFLPAEPGHVFDLLANHTGWTSWFRGMRKVRADDQRTGVGSERTVWVGPSRIGEKFLVWDEGSRMTFDFTSSNLPGLRAGQEDWIMTRDGEGTRLSITVGVEASGPLRRFPVLVKGIISRATSGQTGIIRAFS